MTRKTALRILLLSAMAPRLRAKGETIEIVIEGADLATPVHITDPKIAPRFDLGSLMIADWNRPVSKAPETKKTYRVSFVTTRRDPSTYVVHYAPDPAGQIGYVYLPGKADPEYRDNTWLILRHNEGAWFRASSGWENIALPLIRNARRQ